MAGKREDANLIVELAKWGSMIGLPEASRTIFSDDFDQESAEALDPHVQTILVFHETVGTLVKNDLLDRDAGARLALGLRRVGPRRPGRAARHAHTPACRSCGRTSRRWRRARARRAGQPAARSASPATIRAVAGS